LGLILKFTLVYSRTTRVQIRALHPMLKSRIREKVELLRHNPYAGKYLQRELSAYFSLRVKRYRFIYKIDQENRKIGIHFIGPRNDIYELFREQLTDRTYWSDSVKESSDLWEDIPDASELRKNQGTDVEREQL